MLDDRWNAKAVQGLDRYVTDHLAPIADGRMVVLAADPLRRPVQEQMHRACGRQGLEVRSVTLEAEARDTVAELLQTEIALVFIEGTRSTFRDVVQHHFRNGTVAGAVSRLFDASAEVFDACFQVPIAELRDLNRRLIERASEAEVMHISSAAGTDLEVTFDLRFAWVDSSGLYSPVSPAVLPPSEVATYSPEVNGTIVADGAINANFEYPHDPRLAGRPVLVEVERSVARSVSCDDEFVLRVVAACLSGDYGGRVGEVGIGTNIGIETFVPFLSHINERHPGLHLGFGAHHQDPRLVGWSYPWHVDLIVDKCDIELDGELIMKDGAFVGAVGENDVDRGEHVVTANRVHADTI